MKKPMIHEQIIDHKLIDQWVAGLEKDQPLPQLTDKDLKGLYAYAHRFYIDGKYQDAIHFFHLLTLFDTTCQKYWMGLGASYQMLQEYREALNAYGHAALIDPKKAEASLHAAQCFFYLKLKNEANSALKSAEKMAKGKKEILREIEKLRKKMEKLDG